MTTQQSEGAAAREARMQLKASGAPEAKWRQSFKANGSKSWAVVTTTTRSSEVKMENWPMALAMWRSLGIPTSGTLLR